MSEKKLIGVVDWFGTSDGKMFGFIQFHDEFQQLQSVFFHKNQISEINQKHIHKFSENTVVTFEIKASARKKDKLEAYQVLLLDDENDINFLCKIFFKYLKHSKKHEIYCQVFKKLQNIKTQQFDNLLELTKNIEECLQENLDEDLLKIFSGYISQNNELSQKIISNFVQRIVESPTYFSTAIKEIQQYFIKNKSFLEDFLSNILDLIQKDKIELEFKELKILLENVASDDLTNILNICLKKYQVDMLLKFFFDRNLLLFNQYHYEVILNLLLKNNNFNDVFLNDNQMQNFFQYLVEYQLQSYIPKVISLLNYENITKIILSKKLKIPVQYYEKILINLLDDQTFLDMLRNQEFFKKIYDNLTDYNLLQLIGSILQKVDIETKIIWWINDIITDFDFSSYSAYIGNLNEELQQLFVKKIFYYKFKGILTIDLYQILAMKTNDYSTKVVFVLLEYLVNHQTFNQNLKYDLIKVISDSNLAVHANDILQLKGYFNICQGRWIEICRYDNENSAKNNVEQTNGKHYHYKQDNIEMLNNKPIICDGQISIKNGVLNLSRGGKHFWWCKNKQCFRISRRYANHVDNWKNYTLIDFLGILGILNQDNYQDMDDKIGLLYGTINHVNKFLSRLNCRGCKCLLKPNGNSNYTFYRVRNFSCENPNCTNPDRDVYLSHCSNGFKCSGIIDSRVSERCSNNFVICNECFACCDEKRLTNRNDNRKVNNLGEFVWSSPHRGQVILCPQCANTMQFRDIHQKRQAHENMIKKLEMLYNDGTPREQNIIGNCGIYQNNHQKWFVLYQRHLPKEQFLNWLYELQEIGFHVTDFPEDLNRNYYRVITGLDRDLNQINVFHCRYCQITYNYVNDNERKQAVQHWHYSLFNQIT